MLWTRPRAKVKYQGPSGSDRAQAYSQMAVDAQRCSVPLSIVQVAESGERTGPGLCLIPTQWPPGDLFFPSGDKYWETWMLQVERFNAGGGRWCYYFSLIPGGVALRIYRKGVYCQNLCRPGLYQTIFQQLYLAKLLWTRDQQSPSLLGLLLPGFKPRGTGYESIYNAIISTRLTYFYKTQKFHMRFFGGFCWKPWFFFGLVFVTFNYPMGMWYTCSHMCPETAGTINP